MKFVWLDEDKYPNQIPFLKDNCEATKESIDPDVVVYRIKKVTGAILSQMKVMESCGFLKIIRSEVELESIDDIIPMTTRVEIMKGAPMYLKIYFSNWQITLSDSDLLSPIQFRKCLLQEGHFLIISSEDWNKIVQTWLNMSEEIWEETRNDIIIRKVLNYLGDCVIYEDVAVSRNTLWYNKEEKKDKNIVYCNIDVVVDWVNVKQRDAECVNARQLRGILSEYIDGNSVQKRIYGRRCGFWRFKIDKTEVDLDKKLQTKEKIEEHRKEDEDPSAEDPDDPYRGIMHRNRPYPRGSRWKDKDKLK